MHDVAAQHEVWNEVGPPLFLTATAIAASLGIELVKKPTMGSNGLPSPENDLPAGRLSIADIRAAITQPGPGVDPTVAAKAVADLMSKGT